MKRTILAVSAFAASLMVSAVAVSAPVQAEEIFHSRKAVAEVVATTPLYEAQDDTQTTTTTTTDLSGENTPETTTTLDSAVTGSEETTTTTTTVPLQVVTVNATLHASFNGDKEDAPSTPVSISSDAQQETYTISCDLTDPSTALDYVYLDFALPDAKQSIRTFCPNFTPAVTKVSTGADLLTDVPYTMGANAVNYTYTDATGNQYVRVVLYDATATGDGYLAQNAAITDKLQLTFQLTGLQSFDPTVTTTATSDTVTTTTVNVNGAYDTNGKGGSYNSGSYGSNGSSSAPTSTSTPTQTADLSVGAIVVGAVAAVSLAGAAFTVTRSKPELIRNGGWFFLSVSGTLLKNKLPFCADCIFTANEKYGIIASGIEKRCRRTKNARMYRGSTSSVKREKNGGDIA